jgi:hypothetical protein
MDPNELDAVDDVVQALVVAKYALEAGDSPVAAEAVEGALAKARRLLSASGTAAECAG